MPFGFNFGYGFGYIGDVASIPSVLAWISLNGELTLSDFTGADNMELIDTINPLAQLPKLGMTFLRDISALDADGIGAPLDDGYSTAENEITGTKYYFSQTGDDTTGDGSITTPWKSWAKAKTIFRTMNDGDGILLKRNDEWKADDVGEDFTTLSYTVTGTDIDRKTITSYGLGNRPSLNGISNQDTGLTWATDTSGVVPLWYTDDIVSSATKIACVYIDGVQALGCASLEEDIKLNAKWKWYHDPYGDEGIAGRLYLSVDPTTVSLEWSDVPYIIRYVTGSSNLSFKHLDMKHTREASVSIAGNAVGIETEFCTTGEGTEYGIVYAGDNTKIKYNIVDCKRPLYDYADGSSTSPYGGYEGIRNWSRVGASNCEIAYNTVNGFSHANIAINGGINATEGYYDNIECHHNDFQATTLIYGGKLSTQYRVSNVNFHHNLQIGGDNNQLNGRNGHYHNNWIINKINTPMSNKPYNNGNGFQTAVLEDGFVDNVIEYNIFYGLTGVAVYMVGSDTAETTNTIIRKNIMLDCGREYLIYDGDITGVGIFVKTNKAVPILNTTVEDNIVFTPQPVTKQIVVADESDRNLAQNQYTVDEANAGTFANGLTFTGNLDTDPLCLNPEGHDFRVAYASDAIKANETNIGMYDLPKTSVKPTNVPATTGQGLQFVGTDALELAVTTSEARTIRFTADFNSTALQYIFDDDGPTGARYQYIVISFATIKIRYDGTEKSYTFGGNMSTLGGMRIGVVYGDDNTYLYANGKLVATFIARVISESSNHLFIGKKYNNTGYLQANLGNVQYLKDIKSTSDMWKDYIDPNASLLNAIENKEGNSVMVLPLLEGTGLPVEQTTGALVTSGFTDIETAWGNASSLSYSLQKIYFNDDLTKANTMHISTDYNQIIAVVPTEAYTVKWTTSNNTTYELSTFTTNIDTNQMLAHMGASDAEVKSIEVI